MMPPTDLDNLHPRVAVLEAGQRNLREDLRDLKSEDIAEIKRSVQALRNDWHESRHGMARGEKIALAGVSITVVMAIIAAIALIQTAPT
jgi:hypothetical protein